MENEDIERCKNHWIVKGPGVKTLWGNSPNGTNADFWSWIKRDTLDEGVVYCSPKAITTVLYQPGIISIGLCRDPSKCYKIKPYEIPRNLYLLCMEDVV